MYRVVCSKHNPHEYGNLQKVYSTTFVAIFTSRKSSFLETTLNIYKSYPRHISCSTFYV